MSNSSDNLSFVTRHTTLTNLDQVTGSAMARIDKCLNVTGILFIKNERIEVCTIPAATAQTLITRLPTCNTAMMHAVSELLSWPTSQCRSLKSRWSTDTTMKTNHDQQDISDELVAYRIRTKSTEILVAANEDFTACVTLRLRRRKHKRMKIVSNLLKDAQDEWLVKTTALINNVNPMIDRVMDDESIEGVIMTNREGAAILTNISSTRATNYGQSLHRIGQLARMYIKELDTADEVLVTRINTKKMEIMVAPHPEFNIILIQNTSHKVKTKKLKTKTV